MSKPEFHSVEAKALRAEAGVALTQARGFHDEQMRLSKAGTLTEARAAELDASYLAAFGEYQKKIELAGAFETLPARQAADDEVEVRHPRGTSKADGDDDGKGKASTSGATIESRDAEGNGRSDSSGSFALEAALRRLPETSVEHRALLRKVITNGEGALSFEERSILSPYRDQEGGWAMANQISAEVIRQQHEATHIMSLARVIPLTKGASISFPTFHYSGTGLSPHRVHDVWGTKSFSELLGMTTLTPQSYGDVVKVPIEMVEDLDFPLMEFIAEELQFTDDETVDSDCLLGEGRGSTLGILKAPISDYPTAATTLKPDDIKSFPYKLSESRRRAAVWMTSRAALAEISKMRDDSGAAPGTGGYIFRHGLEEADPRQLVGFPVRESEFFPDGVADAAAAGTAIALFGNWQRGYWYVIRLAISVKQLAETEENNVKFKWRKRAVGAPVRLDFFASLVKA